ncbi:MAG TPA: response regulator transcription factor [Chthoniobacteraceae bacterium]|nr:response regulator transcription factor [Chthoniobacteraceae bacterium]
MEKILIIEDEKRTRENLVILLEMEGYAVRSAANGREGLDLARREAVHLVLCDIALPEVNGHQVLETLRNHPATAEIPFVFFTANGERCNIRTGMDLGADDYLVKPVGASELLACVRARLKRRLRASAPPFSPDFGSPAPLHALGLTRREAEVLLWVAQGKSNHEIALILETAKNTIKRHLQNIFEKIGVDNRHAATVQALEVLHRAGERPPEAPPA